MIGDYPQTLPYICIYIYIYVCVTLFDDYSREIMEGLCAYKRLKTLCANKRYDMSCTEILACDRWHVS